MVSPGELVGAGGEAYVPNPLSRHFQFPVTCLRLFHKGDVALSPIALTHRLSPLPLQYRPHPLSARSSNSHSPTRTLSLSTMTGPYHGGGGITQLLTPVPKLLEDLDLKGKTVLVTGGNTDLGFEMTVGVRLSLASDPFRRAMRQRPVWRSSKMQTLLSNRSTPPGVVPTSTIHFPPHGRL